ncbi:Bug family tripartite tricarboxylate transporter substrate binding protein [Verticiella sediminum]|nr:tripartite tricarboxylate transporter substrate-binding protein [Verticiella sediminum]
MGTDLLVSRRQLLVAAAGAAIVGVAHAGPYPDRAITLLLTTSPGSAVDAIARVMAPHMSRALGQSVVVDNRPGSSGIIATGQMVRSPADGYTLGMTSSTHCINPHLHEKMPYDTLTDVQPICVMTSGPAMLVVHPDLPVGNLHEFIALARSRSAAQPLVIGNAGNGSAVQLAAALLESSTGIRFIHAPYKSNTSYVQDIVGHHIDAGFLPVIAAQPLVRSGRLKALALSTAQRIPTLPDLPTVAESGVPGFDVDGWLALIGPAGIPAPALERINGEVVRALHAPDVVRLVHESGGTVLASSVEEAEHIFRREYEKAGRIIKTAGIKAE